MADNLLDKASILLTPTAYNDGRMLSVKPNENLYGSELVTNGDFATDSDWTKGTGWSIANGKASRTSQSGSTSMYQSVSFTANKSYKITYDLDISAGSFLLRIGGGALIDTTPRTTSGTYTEYIVANSGNNVLNLRAVDGNFIGSIDNVSVVEDLSGDFTFSRSSAATRVNAQGLVENVQIISSELVSNGNFSQIGTEEVSNGNFSQEGSELVTNGDFATDSDWAIFGSSISISGGKLNFVNATSNSEFAQQSIVAPIGKTYKITLDVSNLGSGESIKIRYPFQDFTINTNGTHILYGVGNTANVFRLTPNSSTASFSIDNVSVKEVGQDWSLETGWSIGEDIANCINGSGVSIYQTNAVDVGKQYKLTFNVSNYSQGWLETVGGFVSGVLAEADGYYEVYGTAASTTFGFSAFGSFNGSITNISVKEVGQDWTLGTGWSIGEDKAICDGTQTTFTGLIQDNVFTSGKTYKLTFNIVSNSQQFNFWVNGSQNIFATSFLSDGFKDYTFTASASGKAYFEASSSFVGSVTNISVKEITDDTDLPRINYEGFSYQDSLGSELVVNGGFDTDSNWNKTQATISNGEANISSDGSYTAIDQSNVSVIGKNYFYSINVKSITGTMQFRLGSGTDVDITTIGIKTGYIVATSTTLEIKRKSGAGAINATIDNVSVKEVLGQEVVPDSGCGSWLLEPQSTNLITQSELFSDAVWTKSGTTVTSGFLSPDGTTNAFKLVEGTNNGIHQLKAIGINTVVDRYNFSVFVKPNGRNEIRIVGTNYFSSGTDAYFNLETKVIIYGARAENGLIETLANGWFRCSFSSSGGEFAGNNAHMNIETALNNSNSYQGDGTSGVYIFGAMVEQNSFSTSYIPTSGAASTRLQDIANNSGNSTLINSTEGVLYADIAALANDLTNRTIGILGDSNNLIELAYRNSTNQIRCLIKSSGVFEVNLQHTLSDITSYNKIAIKYKNNDCSLWVNGFEVGTDTSASMPSGLSELNFNRFDETEDFYGKTKALAVYKEVLTDANLRSLTYPNPVATTFDLDFDTIAEQFTFTRGSEATFVNAQGLIESTASNDAPRIDYSTGAKAFLLEPQSTNLIPYSEDFSEWTNTRSSDSIGFTSPNGTNNATLLITESDSASNNKYIQSDLFNISSGAKITGSVFLKANQLNWARVILVNSSLNKSIDCFFNLESGVVGTSSATGSSTVSSTSIEDYGNGWFRCNIVGDLDTSTNCRMRCYLADGDNDSSVYGDGTSGIYIYGAQIEQQSYATSYIPTSGASATRNQELCNNATPVINSEEGTLYAEISALVDNNDGSKSISISSGAYSDNIIMQYTTNTNQIVFKTSPSYTTPIFQSYNVSDITENSKIAFKYKLNDCSFWHNGVKLGSVTSFTPFLYGTLTELNFNRGDGNEGFLGNTKGLKYYPKALADVQLEDLTTI